MILSEINIFYCLENISEDLDMGDKLAVSDLFHTYFCQLE